MAVTLGSDTLAPLGSLPGAAPQCISDSLDVYCIHTQVPHASANHLHVQTSCVSQACDLGTRHHRFRFRLQNLDLLRPRSMVFQSSIE